MSFNSVSRGAAGLNIGRSSTSNMNGGDLSNGVHSSPSATILDTLKKKMNQLKDELEQSRDDHERSRHTLEEEKRRREVVS